MRDALSLSRLRDLAQKTVFLPGTDLLPSQNRALYSALKAKWMY